MERFLGTVLASPCVGAMRRDFCFSSVAPWPAPSLRSLVLCRVPSLDPALCLFLAPFPCHDPCLYDCLAPSPSSPALLSCLVRAKLQRKNPCVEIRTSKKNSASAQFQTFAIYIKKFSTFISIFPGCKVRTS